jgi:DNA ligase 1
MTDYLVDLFQKTPKDIVDKVVYLIQGKLYPDFTGIEVGIAEKMAFKAIEKATGVDRKNLEKSFNETGDVGTTTQNNMKTRTQLIAPFKSLTVETVYDTLDKIAKAVGSGSSETKINLLVSLLNQASPNEAKYIVRMATGELRLGVADMTILDALAVAYGGGKESRKEIERAYNISSDLGDVATTLAEKGMEAILRFKVTVGKPVRPMLAERLPSAREILDKLGGRCAAEYKYDGERLQIHKSKEKVEVFSRKMENITGQYPDAQDLALANLKPEEAIVEAEGVAIDVETGELKPFQDLMHRRRKYGIKEMVKRYPVALFVFDALFLDGKDLTQKNYLERRKRLEDAIRESNRIKASTQIVTENETDFEKFFEEAIEAGCEGIIAKSISSEAVYQAGARGWLWIKYKRDYKSEMTDTVDLVVVGAFHGRGQRAGTYGSLLLAVYDGAEDVFRTICKIGSGFTDEDLKKFPEILQARIIPHKHARVDSKIEADFWFTPAVVIEAIGAEITLSPIHTCAMNKVRKDSGLAIRFPRFTGKYRTDKAPEDATTVSEIEEMYGSQLKKISRV